jgi:hypothetical protein
MLLIAGVLFTVALVLFSLWGTANLAALAVEGMRRKERGLAFLPGVRGHGSDDCVVEPSLVALDSPPAASVQVRVQGVPMGWLMPG